MPQQSATRDKCSVKTIFKEGFFSLAYSVTSRGGLLITNLIAVKLLTVNDYGILSLYLTIATSIATLSTFGLGVTANKVAASSNTSDPELVKAVISTSLAASATFGLIISLLYWPFASDDYIRSIGPAAAFLSILFIASIISASSVLEGALFGTRNYKKLFQNAAISTTITIPIVAAAAQLAGLFGTVVAVIMSRTLLMQLHFHALKRLNWISIDITTTRTKYKEIRQALLNTSIPIALSGILAGPVIAAALIIVVDENGPASAGFFSWPYQIYLVATFIPGALGHFFTSRFASKSNRTCRSQLFQATAFNILIACVSCLMMLTLRDPALRLAGDTFLEHADETYTLFAYSVLLYGLNAAFLSYWTTTNQAWIHLLAQTVWSTTMIVTVAVQAASKGAAAIPLGYFYGYVAQTIVQYAVFSKTSHKDGKCDQHT